MDERRMWFEMDETHLSETNFKNGADSRTEWIGWKDSRTREIWGYASAAIWGRNSIDMNEVFFRAEWRGENRSEK